MSTLFEDRERGYEAKWAHDEEMHFKIMSLRNARLAHWAADMMMLPTGQRAQYAETVMGSGVSDPKDDPIFAKIRNDLAANNIDCPDSTIRQKMQELYNQAEKDLTRG